MYGRMLKLFLYLMCIKARYAAAKETAKFVDQRDMSEHCRRRVVPSVFLGQHVTDANSQVMQFSQLEVPYSCSLSVRAEAGNNIILIIQLLSEESLIDACEINGDQLIVYELGETFGGYWGPIPNVIMKEPDKNYTQYYTLKTTRPPTTRKLKPKTTQVKHLKETETQSTMTEQEYYTIDVPIVNVSGNFELGPRRETNDSEDLFNYIYDVTPRNGVEYETSIMPLVQFSIRKQSNGYEGEAPRYELDYDTKELTVDPRLIFNTAKKKRISFRRDWKANRRLRHRSKTTNMLRRADNKKLYTKQSPLFTEVTDAVPSIPTLDSNYFTNSYELVDDIMRSINVTTLRSTVSQNKTFRNIVDNIFNSRHNSSVYLASNISIYNVDVSTRHNETIMEDETDSNQSVDNSKLVEIEALGISTNSSLRASIQRPGRVTLDLSELTTENYLRTENEKTDANITDIEITSLEGIQIDGTNMTTDKLSLRNELLTENTTVPSTTTNTSIKTSFLTGAMVDHESWENIVQAAPVMAVVLNNTEPLITNTITKVSNKRKHKRYIQSLEIDQSRPRNLTTKRSLTSEEKPFEDVQDLARLVELEDDEMGSRVALRYLRHYVGPAMFNLCGHREPSLRQTFLFNSSRIVIAVSNFTLDRMMLVLTPAQTLPTGVSQCPPGQLECQIVGTRVCIDSLNACDGVPNCGSYEIYDEDRLSCGTAHGVQHSVYLAALTFLAVILTTAYITLYWLERCVPRVSDAFFVYSDSSENELLLESVMRSPNDDEDSSYKINYLGHFFEDDVLYQDLNAVPKKGNFCKQIFNACWTFLGFRKTSTAYPSEKIITENQLPKKEPSRMFSFTQLELRKFGKLEFKDESVQTSASFELRDLNIQQKKKEKNSLTSLIKFKSKSYQHDTNRQDSELNLLKFSKESKSLLSQNSMSFDNSNRKKKLAVGTETDKELEIENTVYEHVPTSSGKVPVVCEVHTKPKKNIEPSKRLRFDSELKMISTIQEDDTNWSVSSSVQRINNEDLNKIVEVQEEGSGRDFRRFFGAKGKKCKKIKLKHLS